MLFPFCLPTCRHFMLNAHVDFFFAQICHFKTKEPLGNTLFLLMQFSWKVILFFVCWIVNTPICSLTPHTYAIDWYNKSNDINQFQASEKSTNDEIDCENVTSDFDSNQSPRRKFSKKGSQSFRLQKSFDREESHHTLYELVEISKSSSTIRSSTITCKFAPCHGHHQFKPMPSVHFSQSQTSISESSSKMRIQGNGKRMPIRISSLKRETKAAQTLSMVVGGFIACWLPFFIYYLLIPFLPKESVSEDLMVVLTWLGWISSGINPFIYAFYNTDFRIAFWRLTLRKCFKNQNTLALFKP